MPTRSVVVEARTIYTATVGGDTIWAGDGSDKVWGGRGDDAIHTEGDNRLGSANSDFIDCGPGYDTVYVDSGGGDPETGSFKPPDGFLDNCNDFK